LEVIETGTVQLFDTFLREAIAVSDQTRQHPVTTYPFDDLIQAWMQ
jgi:hypothetical protein